ncbi:hypothetical protein PCH_Pc18g03790 [Penicillium rubens Wisconsin 54-1255]|uniref:Uncharacterized protein n=1 Tax=Penicillium rubens (strain ATCC 28089 / DSM 1075 / NRRL 1951 / Wisconsin 54-1255) TaxID=500485 RepID=B6HBE3_PENRW|nr:hypothetical protein PCH_Pc18g03790 [Penicillium rubens Wisconsin 54-1255]
MERLIQRPWTNVLIDTDEHMRLSEDAKTPIVFRGLIQHKVLVKVLWREEKGAARQSTKALIMVHPPVCNVQQPLGGKSDDKIGIGPIDGHGALDPAKAGLTAQRRAT